jgi:hypothetical protein
MRYYITTRQTILYSCLALVHSFPSVTSIRILAPTTKIISSLSIEASRVTVPRHNSPDNQDSAYPLRHNFIIPWKPQNTHTIDLEMTHHGSTHPNSWKPARVLTILNNPSCKYGGTHLAINWGRRAQCRPRFFRRANRLTSSIKEADAPSLPSSPALAPARARATRRPLDWTAHCRRHPAVPPTSASPPRPRRCSVLAGFATSTLAPLVLPLFALMTSCRSPRRRPSLRDAAAACGRNA